MSRLVMEWETDTVLFCPVRDNMPEYYKYFSALDLFYSELSEAFSLFESDIISLTMPGVHAKKCRKLLANKTSIVESLLPDIWLRDYMPFQTDEGFVKFIYNPSYNRAEWNSPIDIEVCNLFNNLLDFKIKYVDLLLDGGNFTSNGSIGLLTERVFKDNKEKTKSEIEKILIENLFLEKIIFIPPEPYEKTGHIDGIVRWINSDSYITNRYISNERYEYRLKRVLDKELSGFRRIEIPFTPSGISLKLTMMKEGKQTWQGAEGVYVNFLQTKNAVYVPTFGLAIEQEVLELFNACFTKPVVLIDSGAISKFGGVLNCISWSYKSCSNAMNHHVALLR